jgi:hypothetical protein
MTIYAMTLKQIRRAYANRIKRVRKNIAILAGR